jgi:hypothetical protein
MSAPVNPIAPPQGEDVQPALASTWKDRAVEFISTPNHQKAFGSLGTAAIIAGIVLLAVATHGLALPILGGMLVGLGATSVGTGFAGNYLESKHITQMSIESPAAATIPPLPKRPNTTHELMVREQAYSEELVGIAGPATNLQDLLDAIQETRSEELPTLIALVQADDTANQTDNLSALFNLVLDDTQMDETFRTELLKQTKTENRNFTFSEVKFEEPKTEEVAEEAPSRFWPVAQVVGYIALVLSGAYLARASQKIVRTDDICKEMIRSVRPLPTSALLSYCDDLHKAVVVVDRVNERGEPSAYRTIPYKNFHFAPAAK